MLCIIIVWGLTYEPIQPLDVLSPNELENQKLHFTKVNIHQLNEC